MPGRLRSLPMIVGVTIAACVGCGGTSSPSSTGDAVPPAFKDRDATASELFAEYSDALVAKDAAVLGRIFGDEFLIQRTDGSWTDKGGFLDRLPDLRSFEIDDVVERRGNNVIVARFTAMADLAIDATEYRMSAAPMLVVFEWIEGRWALQAQGNFNLPQD